MSRRLLLTTIVALSVALLSFGKTKVVSTEYIYHIPDNISQEEARAISLQRAQSQAIADEFGCIVTQSSSVSISSHNGDTDTDFLSIGGSQLKGEWLETIGEPKYEFITNGNMMALKVSVKGKIRELEGTETPFDVKILRNGVTDADENDRFASGDTMYISFNAPMSGYLAVYLIDSEKQAFCLLPYQQSESGIFQTKANKKYLLFHPEYALGVASDMVDEYILETDKGRERNRILAIFSPNKFYKAADNSTSSELPRNLSYATFQKWLSKMKQRDTDLSVVEKSIVISNISSKE